MISMLRDSKSPLLWLLVNSLENFSELNKKILTSSSTLILKSLEFFQINTEIKVVFYKELMENSQIKSIEFMVSMKSSWTT